MERLPAGAAGVLAVVGVVVLAVLGDDSIDRVIAAEGEALLGLRGRRRRGRVAALAGTERGGDTLEEVLRVVRAITRVGVVGEAAVVVVVGCVAATVARDGCGWRLVPPPGIRRSCKANAPTPTRATNGGGRNVRHLHVPVGPIAKPREECSEAGVIPKIERVNFTRAAVRHCAESRRRWHLYLCVEKTLWRG
jgi:hypothetical protein